MTAERKNTKERSKMTADRRKIASCTQQKLFSNS